MPVMVEHYSRSIWEAAMRFVQLIEFKTSDIDAAADPGNSPLSITETLQLIAGTGRS